MSEERKIETVEHLCNRLQQLVDAGYGDCDIKCRDGYLYDDAWGFDPQKREYRIYGFYSDSDIGSKVEELEKDLKKVFKKYKDAMMGIPYEE